MGFPIRVRLLGSFALDISFGTPPLGGAVATRPETGIIFASCRRDDPAYTESKFHICGPKSVSVDLWIEVLIHVNLSLAL